MWNNFLAEIVKYLTSPMALFDVKWNLPTFASANISHLRSKYFTAKLFHLPARANFVEKSTSATQMCFFLELVIRIELMTSSLPMTCSTDWAIPASLRLWYYSRLFPLCQGLFQKYFCFFASFLRKEAFFGTVAGKTCFQTVDNRIKLWYTFLNAMNKRSRFSGTLREGAVGASPRGKKVEVACERCGGRDFPQ